MAQSRYIDKKSVGKISFEFESQDDFVRIIEQLNRKYGK